MLAEKWIKNAISLTRYDHHCLHLCFLARTITVNVISCYAPQSFLSVEEKDTFCNKISLITVVPNEVIKLVGGDFNGYAGQCSVRLKGVHGGNDYGVMGLWCENQGRCEY